MNIAQIKAEIGYAALNMVQQFDSPKDKEDNKPNGWLSHWDNTNRVRVSVPTEVYDKIKANPELDTLAVKTEVVEPKPVMKNGQPVLEADGKTPKMTESYTRHVIITPKHLKGTL